MTPFSFASKKLILFDLDGTLIDSAPVLLDVLRQTLQQADFPYQLKHMPCCSDVWIGKISLGLDALMRYALQDTQKAYDLSEWKSYFLQCYEQRVGSSKPFYHVPLVLQQLVQAGIPWGIVSNKDKFFVQHLVQTHFQCNLPQVIVCPTVDLRPKPEPDLLQHALQIIGITATQACYVGDDWVDCLAAHRVGCDFIAAQYGYWRSEPEILQWPCQGRISCPKALLYYLQ